MRGEPNAIGIPTKWKPTRDEDAFFTDAVLDNSAVMRDVDNAFDILEQFSSTGGVVVIPMDGIGTDRAELQNRAPAFLEYINIRLRELE